MSSQLALAPLASATALQVKQRTDWHESFSGFESANQYEVMGPAGTVFQVAEQSDGFLAMLARQFLNTARPFTLHFATGSGGVVALAKRPFRFYFHEVEVEAGGRSLGAVRRKWSILRRRFTVLGPAGEERLELVGPILKPWTFLIERDGAEVGKITKKWSGLGKEMFSDADTFGVDYEGQFRDEEKMLLLAAVFLIDFLYFEKKNNS